MPGKLEFSDEPWFLKSYRNKTVLIVTSSRGATIQGYNHYPFKSILDLALQQDGSWIIVDLTQAMFTGSTALRIMVSALRDAKHQGKGLFLVFPYSGRVHEIFQLAGLDTIFDHFFTLDDAIQNIDKRNLRSALMEAQAEAALGGHDIGAFEAVDNGYQATCRVCGGTTWLNDKGLRYSLLEDACEGSTYSRFV